MTKIAYLQCTTGIAGDMLLGALVSAGVPLSYIRESLANLNMVNEYEITTETVTRNTITATKVDVNLTSSSHHHHHHHHRHLSQIETIIAQGNLPPDVTKNSLAIFRNLAIAEAKVHGTTVEKVHFHEVGAVDAIVDIVGCCLGLDYLGIKELYCSALPSGGGIVKAAHGSLPVPVPAVLELWQTRQVPVYSNGIEKELVTPTGAAIVTTLAVDFGNIPPMVIEKTGLGAGSQDLAIPNILRLWLGEKEDNSNLEIVTVLETQIDDCNPQIIAYLLEELLTIGAKDVFTQPVTMKKNRLGILLTVICGEDKVIVCENLIFRETTTLGIRRQTQQRRIVDREIIKVNTKYGVVRIKVAKKDGEILNIHPEYQDCADVARQLNIPLRVIFQEAIQQYYREFNP